MSDPKKTALFILYILVTGIVLIYVLFPSSAVKDHITNRINRNTTDLRVDIGDLRLVFPPAILLREVTIENNKNGLFFIDRLKLSPRWRSMMLARNALNFRAEAYRGEISGYLSTVTNKEGTQISATGTFSQMQVENIPVVSAQLGDHLTGILSGNFQLDTISPQPATGNGTVYISDGNLISPVSYLNLDRLNFQRIEAEFSFDGNYLEILNAELQGPEMTGSASGTIFLESPISGSRMDIEIELTPLLSSSLSGINTLTIRAGETFGNPKMTIVQAR